MGSLYLYALVYACDIYAISIVVVGCGTPGLIRLVVKTLSGLMLIETSPALCDKLAY